MDINWKRAATATGFGLIPAFLAYMMLSIATASETGLVWVFFVGIPVFGYLIYREATVREQAGGMFFWLAVESLLTPLVFLLYTVAFAGEQTTTDAETAGAAIGGVILVVGAFLIAVPLAGVFYLISRRLSG